MLAFPGRMKRLAEWNAAVHAFTTKHTTDEVVELASLMRIPVAQVNSGRTVLEHEQFVASATCSSTEPTATSAQPRPPYLIDGAVAGAAATCAEAG